MLLVWLVMAAIPLQGFAAASMLLCGMGASHAPAAAEHDHAKHGHDNAAGTQAKKADDTSGQPAKQLPDSSHKCGVCASCCNSVAITESPQPVAVVHLPQAEWAELFVLIHTGPLQVPDKPPRA